MLTLLLLFSASPDIQFLEDKVDRVEINHYYSNQDCSYVFTQVIFWDWNYEEDRWDIRDWRLEKECYKKESEQEKNIRKKEHQDFYIDLEVRRHLQYKIEKLERSGSKYKINFEKFKANYLKKHTVKIPPFTDRVYNGSSLSLPSNNTLIFKDNKTQNKYRRIKFKQLQETWTTFDPELEARQLLPQDKRNDLSKPKKYELPLELDIK